MRSPAIVPTDSPPTTAPETPVAPDRTATPNPPALPSRPRQRRRRRRRFLLLLALLIAGGGAYAAWQFYFAPTAGEQVQYITSVVAIGDIEDAVSSIGTLSASQSRSVETVISGRIASLDAELGDVVAAGDVVATLELAGLEAALVVAEAQLASLQSSVADRASQLELAEQNLDRQEGLFAANAAAESAVQSARASVVGATAQLESARSQLVQQQQAVETAHDNLEAAIITAPIAGTIVAQSIEAGQSVNAGAAIATISDLSAMTVEAQVSEADIGRLFVGIPAYFTTLAGSNQRWEGTLRQILPTPSIEQGVVLYSILFDVLNPTGELMIGMSAEAFFVVEGAEDVLRIPIAALQPAGRGGAQNAAGNAAGRGNAAGAAVPAAENVAGAEGVPPAAIAGDDAPAGFDPARFGGGAPAANEANGANGAAEGEAGAAVDVAAGRGNPAAQAGNPAGQQPDADNAARLAERFGGELPEGFDPEAFAQRQRANAGDAAGDLNQAPPGAAQGADASAGTNYLVRILLDDGTIELRPVLIGVTDRVNAEVLSGLQAGERVVTSAIIGAGDAQAPNAGNLPRGLGAGGFGGGGGRF